MGLCFSHSHLDGNYDEVTKICQSRLLATPVTLSNLLSSAKRQQIGPRKPIDLSQHTNGIRRRRKTMAGLFPQVTYLKTIVSKNRKRHKESGFDLDLTYITENVIAMAYPAERVQSMFRNHLNDVHNFLELKHKGHYYVYNLCSEKSYDKAKFDHRVKVFPFHDHNPPSFDVIHTFCTDVDEWLKADRQNVIAIHCKAGKGRTGTMICCYLLFSGMYQDADEAIQFYGQKRTQDGQGVTIPSQIRYVRYYAEYLRKELQYKPRRIYIKRIELRPAPKFTEQILFTVRQKKTLTMEQPRFQGKETKPDAKRVGDFGECKTMEEKAGKDPEMGLGFKSRNFTFQVDDPVVCMDDKIIKTLNGDVRIELFFRSPLLTKKKKFARIWINTFFAVRDGIRIDDYKKYLVFKKHELDIAGKKDKNHKLLPEEFEVKVFMKVPSTTEEIDAALEEAKKKEKEQDKEMDSSGTEDESEDENDWESGKSRSTKKRTDEGSKVRSLKSKNGNSKPSKRKMVAGPSRVDAVVQSSSNMIASTSKVSTVDESFKKPVASLLTTNLTEGTSPSITSSSSEVTPNTSVLTAVNLRRESKSLLSTDSGGSMDTHRNLEVVPSRSSQTIAMIPNEIFDESHADRKSSVDDIEMAPEAGPSDPSNVSRSDVPTETKRKKSGNGFFKFFNRKFRSKK